MRTLALMVVAALFASSGASAQPAPHATTPHATTPRAAAAAARPQLFKKEGEAQTICTGDTVVWGNSTTHVYHLAGSPLYGKTKRGGYMCQKAADGGGYHAAKGGA